ncbi:MAG: glycosyltransferase family 4 protein [Lentisphaeraceae bacterium]|nr:glycosyltransferase family 4 protein [Lentisphaeraceae bacterium]
MIKNILHILWDGHHGGVQRYVQKVVTNKNWQHKKHTILLLSEEGELINTLDDIGIEVICLNIDSKYQILDCFEQIQDIVKSKRVDLIHCHCDSLFVLAQLRFIQNCKKIYTEHGDSFVRTGRKFLTKIIWRLNGSIWNKVILNSEYTKGKFLSKFPYLNNAVKVICNPLLESVTPKIRKMSENPKVGTLGRLAKVKGNDLFLKAAKKVSIVAPNVTFHIFGDGEEKEQLEKQVNDLNLQEKVTFHGFTSNPIEKLQELDCLTVPSRAESFGLSAVESLAAGTPVAAFDQTGVADFVVTGKNGSLARMEDCDDLAKSIISIINDPSNWKNLSLKGIDTVSTKFCLVNHISKLEQTYNEVLHEKQQTQKA